MEESGIVDDSSTYFHTQIMTHKKAGDRKRGWRDGCQIVGSTQTLKVQAENRSILLNAENHLQKIIQKCERHQSLLESGKQELEKLRQESKKHLAQCASVREKLSAENRKKSEDRSSYPEVPQKVKREVDETLMKLAEKQKLELENLHKRILYLQNQLNGRQGLELKLETLKSFEADCEQFLGMRKDFQEKKEQVDDLENLATVLLVNEQRAKGELHEARGALMNGLIDFPNPTIGVKKLGELDSLCFLKACKRKYPIEIAEIKAVELCSLWESNLQDFSDWHPFKAILCDGVIIKEDIDMEDERLKNLKDEWGEDLCYTVTNTLRELIEYNPNGRLPVKELWNYEFNRKASLREGAEFLLQKWRTLKRRKR
ncbi:protein INVOLVED IN DE NOVO 2-like [Chenopodium quinoa]|uniref:protein INVOLVED IN DE NOVO 2-like n=1 Tax=Chenopodium quinoa TaxID=63459 RepID=UPI000B76FA71|nr:protein INVOLVED IN DE NOVO 2-like [Chenopodium quinoa]